MTLYAPCSPSSPSLLPLPATPTLSSPLNQLTLELIKLDNGKLDESGLPLTPTLASPPVTPFKSSTLSKEDIPDSPTFSSPPVTPLIKYRSFPEENDSTSLPSTPTLSSPPFTPLIKKNTINLTPTTPLFDDTGLPPTPTFCSPPFTTILQDAEKHEFETETIALPPLPETPTLPSPTYTPLIRMTQEEHTPPFKPLPLPDTPSFASPTFTPAINKVKKSHTYTPIATPTMDSPIRTPGFALRTPSSPYSPASELLPSELDRDQDTWKQ